MNCARCGREPAPEDRFCGSCGVALSAHCQRCGHPLAPEVAFCTACGTPRSGPVPETGTEERRRISVLFIDLIDFTPYAERSDPELVRRMQTTFYANVRRIVGQHGGVVEKYIGDAVMALFGAPVATETDALRCVRAGLELQRVVPPTSTAGASSGYDLRCRIGVATGEALVDLSAAHDGGQAIVAGDVVNTASRLQSAAPPGGVLVCGQTRALTAGAIRYAEQEPVVLRGRSAPTEVWLALAPAAEHATTLDDPPLVEREHELLLLVGALERVVRDRTPQLVTVFGQAGIGKSRLARELHRHALRSVDEPVTWHIGHCRPFGENVTYAPLADMVAAEAGVLDTDPADQVATKLASAVRGVAGDGQSELLTRALRQLVGLPGGDLPAGEAESVWRRFLERVAARGPTVLVFEDLHWADPPMLRFVELLAAGAREVPLLVLTTSRPELIDRDASWAGAITGSLTITLPPLRSSGINSLYAHLLGQVVFPKELVAPLVELADGNPLYAQEYVRMLVERGSLSGQEWTGGSLPTPDSVHAVIANRVDLLDPHDRSVLQAAAVVGTHFWPGAVAAALARPVELVEHALRRLEQRDFIAEQRESAMAGHSEFRFRHVLVRDVCYQRLPRAARVERHERAADWLENASPREHADAGRQSTEVLAHHRWTAHEIARTLGAATPERAAAARAALHLAARRAYGLHALETAARYVERALSLCEPAADPARDLERGLLDLLATEIAFYQDGAAFLASDGVAELTALAGRLATAGAAAEQARAWTLLGQAAWLTADRAEALSCLARAVDLFQPLPDSTEKVDAYAELGRLHMLSYEREPAIDAAETAAAIAQRLGLTEAQANARITIATTRYEAGEPDALAELHEVTEHCRTRGLLALRRATQNLAAAVREEGDWPRSDALWEAGSSDVPGGYNLATTFSVEAQRAYFAGDFATLASVADQYAAAGGGRWGDIRLPRLRACLRVLREEPVPSLGAAADALATARATGFYRSLWTALAWEALSLALQRRAAEAAQLLAELVDTRHKVPVIASGGWVCAAAYAAAQAGREPSEALHASLALQPRQTPWSTAARHTLAGAIAVADGDARAGGRHHLDAAEVHAGIPAHTDRMLALALAADAFSRGGDHQQAEQVRAQVREFAERNAAPGLLRLRHADPGAP